jgi:signal transduction histidine kinase
MPASLRSRLFLNHLAILGLGMGLAALLSWRAVEKLYLESQRENLLAQAQQTAAALQGTPLAGPTVEAYSQTANALAGIHTRVLGERGAIIVELSPGAANAASLQVPPAESGSFTTAEELLQRSEIALALQGQSATAIRRVATAQNQRVLYAAAPIAGVDGAVSGLVYLAMPLPAAGLPASLLLELGGAALAAVSLAIVTGALLSRRITRPVDGIARAAAAVSAGDLSQRVPAEGGIRELNGLGQAFNRMTGSLRQADQAKNSFIADVTHELRTPLTVIMGTIETLEDGALYDTAARGPLLASMQRETDRLIRLVNDLLVLIRADAGTLNMNIQPLDLADVARTRAQHFAALAARRQVRFDVQGEEKAGALVLADADRLSQVLDNLLDNALRYSPESSTVLIELRREGESVACTVSDRGPGIPEEHLPFIFERFYRADPSRNRHSGGAGLGLAIARALIQAQGGRIHAEPFAGGGTTLRFTLPAAGIGTRLPDN